MKLLAFTAMLAATATCNAADVRSIEEAWAYLTTVGNSKQWVVISSKKNNGFVQCARMDGFVRCEFPIWLKVSPSAKQIKPTNSRGTPFPEMPGAKLKQYMSLREVATLKKTVGGLGLRAEDTYSQVADEKGRLAGTAYDIRVVLDMKYAGFTKLVEAILGNVWQTTRQDGYAFETDS